MEEAFLDEPSKFFWMDQVILFPLLNFGTYISCCYCTVSNFFQHTRSFLRTRKIGCKLGLLVFQQFLSVKMFILCSNFKFMLSNSVNVCHKSKVIFKLLFPAPFVSVASGSLWLTPLAVDWTIKFCLFL